LKRNAHREPIRNIRAIPGSREGIRRKRGKGVKSWKKTLREAGVEYKEIPGRATDQSPSVDEPPLKGIATRKTCIAGRGSAQIARDFEAVPAIFSGRGPATLGGLRSRPLADEQTKGGAIERIVFCSGQDVVRDNSHEDDLKACERRAEFSRPPYGLAAALRVCPGVYNAPIAGRRAIVRESDRKWANARIGSPSPRSVFSITFGPAMMGSSGTNFPVNSGGRVFSKSNGGSKLHRGRDPSPIGGLLFKPFFFFFTGGGL